MSYAALSSMKDRLQVTTTTDDAILQASLDWADSLINLICDRRFAAVTATRFFGPERIDWMGNADLVPLGYQSVELPYKRLFVDDDLLTITTITNGDGSVIPSDGFFLEPFNAPADGLPYNSILLKSANAWTWDTDGRVAIAGTWGFTTAPDAFIVNSALLIAEWHYRARSPQDLTTIFDNTTKKAKIEGFPQAVLDALEMRRRLAR